MTDERITAAVERVARAQQDLQDATDALLAAVADETGVDIATLEQVDLTGREAAAIARKTRGAQPWRPPGSNGPSGPWRDPRTLPE
ncbi:hypothetical protein [Nocardia nova]|uniref:Uncharacterized protein n=1 Tax=Nocardia nova SH22a TaxID=1415166 RepID=W5T9N0_9NOCA|nr:hypothetical protein [Nocardia nova]AHH16040.1 hypothetical protein NONO_c12330 [Nocardia nova SH22a]